MVEGVVLIGGMFAVERLGLVDLNALPIHPLMIVVALLAVQYGVFGGLSAAAAATGFSVLGGLLPTRIIGEGYFEYLAAVWSTPLLWLVIAVLLGIISDNHRRALARARTDLAAARRELDVISAQYMALSDRAKRLERLAAGFDRTDHRQG